MPLATLWTELSLSTKGFQSGLSAAQGLAQAWSKKVAGDVRQTFFTALSPNRWLQSTVNSVQQAVAEIGRATSAAGRAREEIEGPPMDPGNEAAIRVLSEKLGMSLQALADLFRDGTEAGAEFRALLGTLVSPNETQRVESYWTAWKTGLGQVYRLLRSLSDRQMGGWVQRMLERIPGSRLLVGAGRTQMQAEERVRELERERREREARSQRQLEQEAYRRAGERARREDEAAMGRARLQTLQGQSGRLLDFGGQERSSLPGGGLASIGGFTAGAGLTALSVERSQLRVLEVIKVNTDVMRRAADIQLEIDRLENQ